MNICFTGHRPNKLGGYDWNTLKNQKIMKEIIYQVQKVMTESKSKDFHFICGGALGVDQMAFAICKKIQEIYINDFNVTLEIAIPFKSQSCKWRSNDVKNYELQKSQADNIVYVDKLTNYKIKGYEEDKYYPAKMQKRNQYMVDKSDMVIAVWDDTKGGTGNCVNYAKKLNKKIIQINPKNII